MFNLLLFSVLELDFEGIVKNTEVGEVKLEKTQKINLGNNALNTRWQHVVSKSFSCEKFDHLVPKLLLLPPKEEEKDTEEEEETFGTKTRDGNPTEHVRLDKLTRRHFTN